MAAQPVGILSAHLYRVRSKKNGNAQCVAILWGQQTVRRGGQQPSVRSIKAWL